MSARSKTSYEQYETAVRGHTPQPQGAHLSGANPYPTFDSDYAPSPVVAEEGTGRKLQELEVHPGDILKVVRMLPGQEWIVVRKMTKKEKGKGKAWDDEKDGLIPADCLRRLDRDDDQSATYSRNGSISTPSLEGTRGSHEGPANSAVGSAGNSTGDIKRNLKMERAMNYEDTPFVEHVGKDITLSNLVREDGRWVARS